MESSDHRKWETERDEICKDVCGGVGDPVDVRIDLVPYRHTVVPPAGDGPDGEEVGEEEGDAPGGDKADDDVHDLGEAARLEEPFVEEENGDFDAGNGDDVEELEGKIGLDRYYT